MITEPLGPYVWNDVLKCRQQQTVYCFCNRILYLKNSLCYFCKQNDQFNSHCAFLGLVMSNLCIIVNGNNTQSIFLKHLFSSNFYCYDLRF